MSVEREQPAGVRVLGRLRRARVRDDPRHQRAQLVDLGEDRQGVAVALGHLAAVEPRDGGDPPVDQDLGRDQHRSVDRVERRRDLARDLHVLLLVTPHRHDLGAEHQDVGRHEQRVGEHARVDAVVGRPAGRLVGAGRRLVGVRAVEQALAGVAGQHPGQLEHLGKVRLAVQGHAQRVDPEREPGGGQLVGVAPHRPAITLRGQRVRVRDEAEDVVAAGQGQRRPDHAEVVSEMRPAARLDAGDRHRPVRLRRASGRRSLDWGCLHGCLLLDLDRSATRRREPPPGPETKAPPLPEAAGLPVDARGCWPPTRATTTSELIQTCAWDDARGPRPPVSTPPAALTIESSGRNTR